MIEVHDFHKTYDSTVAVAGLSFRVAAGEILGLVGPNGAGKTTTLKVLAGALPPTRGQLSIAGKDLQREPVEVKQRVAYVPDDPQLFPDLTVDEHLAFSAAAYRVPAAGQRIASLLQQFQLLDKRRTPARDLSRGMRQKLAVCAGYLHDPQAILLDEPLTGLDPHGIRTFKTSLQQRAAEGSAVIVSSHLLAMVEDICTHVLILSAGEQRFHGPIGQLKQVYRAAGSEASLEDIFFRATDAVTVPVTS